MTREEAVKALIDMANALCLNPNTPQGVALKMAIKALKEQESALDKIRAKILKCLSALDEIEKSEFNIYLPNEISGRRLTYKQCLEFIDKYEADIESQEIEDNQYNREKCYECCNKDKSVLDMPCVKCSAENDYIYFNARDWEYESIGESEE